MTDIHKHSIRVSVDTDQLLALKAYALKVGLPVASVLRTLALTAIRKETSH